MNSPLKSPITNNKCLATLKKLIPEGSVVHSFLFYDGNLEVELANSKRFVIAHTNKYVNYEFWQCLMADPERVSNITTHFSPIESDNIFDILQKEWPKYPDPFMRSAIFYLLNQSSDMGYISSGKLIEGLDLSRQIAKMSNFVCPNLHVQVDEEENYIESINNIESKCDYIFVPVGSFSLNLLEGGKNIGFEQTKVIHADLKNMLLSTDKKVILMYKFSNQTMKFYQNLNTHIIDQWGRHTQSTKFAKEILVANF
jgi:hypothetical protein